MTFSHRPWNQFTQKCWASPQLSKLTTFEQFEVSQAGKCVMSVDDSFEIIFNKLKIDKTILLPFTALQSWSHFISVVCFFLCRDLTHRSTHHRTPSEWVMTIWHGNDLADQNDNDDYCYWLWRCPISKTYKFIFIECYCLSNINFNHCHRQKFFFVCRPGSQTMPWDIWWMRIEEFWHISTTFPSLDFASQYQNKKRTQQRIKISSESPLLPRSILASLGKKSLFSGEKRNNNMESNNISIELFRFSDD